MVCLRWLRDRCLRLPLNTDVSAISNQLNSSAAFRQSAISSISEYWGFPPPRPSSSCSSFSCGGALRGLAADSRKSESRRARQIFRCHRYKRQFLFWQLLTYGIITSHSIFKTPTPDDQILKQSAGLFVRAHGFCGIGFFVHPFCVVCHT